MKKKSKPHSELNISNITKKLINETIFSIYNNTPTQTKSLLYNHLKTRTTQFSSNITLPLLYPFLCIKATPVHQRFSVGTDKASTGEHRSSHVLRGSLNLTKFDFRVDERRPYRGPAAEGKRPAFRGEDALRLITAVDSIRMLTQLLGASLHRRYQSPLLGR